MAKVLERAGFKFFIWSNDHRPAHVHVRKGSAEMTIVLGSVYVKPVIRDTSRNLRDVDAVKGLRIAVEMQAFFLEKWREIHGRD